MDTPLQISFHNLPHSQVIETAIHEAAARLEASHDRIVSCRVIVDLPHKHHKEGNPYQVRIDLKVPGAELVVKREPADAGAPGRSTARSTRPSTRCNGSSTRSPAAAAGS